MIANDISKCSIKPWQMMSRRQRRVKKWRKHLKRLSLQHLNPCFSPTVTHHTKKTQFSRALVTHTRQRCSSWILEFWALGCKGSQDFVISRHVSQLLVRLPTKSGLSSTSLVINFSYTPIQTKYQTTDANVDQAGEEKCSRFCEAQNLIHWLKYDTAC